jgi:hypothetical protein
MMIIQVFKEFARAARRGPGRGPDHGSGFTAGRVLVRRDMLMPPIGRIMGNIDFSNLVIISGQTRASLSRPKISDWPPSTTVCSSTPSSTF